MKKIKLKYLILSIIFINIFFVEYNYASIDVKTSIDTISGIQKTIFITPNGKIIILLPDDIQAGDFISGTIITEMSNRQDNSNSEKLNKYSIGINNEFSPVSDKSVIKFTLPKSSTGGVTYLVLRDDKGNEISRNYITYQNYVVNFNSVSSPSPWEFQTPSLGRSGKYSVVKGPFDGNFGTTSVVVGGSSITKLAESPRQMVFENPINVLGETELLIVERGIEVRRKYQNIQVVKLNDKEDYESKNINVPNNTEIKNTSENTGKAENISKPLDLPEQVKGGYLQETRIDIADKNQIINDSIKTTKIQDAAKVDKISTNESDIPDPDIITSSKLSFSEKPGENNSKYTVQIASYKSEKDALELLNKLESKGYDVTIIKAEIPQKGTWYRVRMGNFFNKNQASNYGLKLTREEPLVNSMFVTLIN